MDFLAAVGVVVVGELAAEFFDQDVGAFVRLDIELVDEVLAFSLGGVVVHEVVVPFLAHAEKGDGAAPVRHHLQRQVGVAVAVKRAALYRQLVQVEVALFGQEHKPLVVKSVVIDVAVIVDGVETVFHLVKEEVHYLDQEHEGGQQFPVLLDVGKAEELHVVKGVGDGEKQSVL